MKRLYKKIISPRSPDPSVHSREVVLNWLLVGSITLSLAAVVNILVSLLGGEHIFGRLFLAGAVMGALAGLYCLARFWHQHIFVSSILILLLFWCAVAVCFTWGTVNPMGILLFSLMIIMAGILLSARWSLYMMFVTALGLAAIEYGKQQGWFVPDLTWMREPSDFVDVLSFIFMFLIIALVSWLFNRQMEISLRRAQRSEAALQVQKASLEIKVEKRTRELQEAQAEKVQHFYRFAELGNLSTALFHDLGNHLSAVTLDIEGLKGGKQSQILKRIQHDVNYINDVVHRVRQQMQQGKGTPTTFNISDEIQEVIKMLEFAARRVQVVINVRHNDDQHLLYRADVVRFRQLMINLIANAIDAYEKTTVKNKAVVVTIDYQHDSKTHVIEVHDLGSGVAKRLQKKIFEPFYSTKEKGSGIGLFIAKQIVEKDFKGSISLVSGGSLGTTFTVRLPD